MGGHENPRLVLTQKRCTQQRVSCMEDMEMYSFVAATSERAASRLALDAGAIVVSTAQQPADPGLVVVSVDDNHAGMVATAFRRSGIWTDRFAAPQRIAIGKPVVSRAASCVVRRP